MATSDFLVVAPGPSPNIVSQATYAANTAVTTGFVSGVAPSAIVNKSFRQSTVMAAVVAQFIADLTGVNSIDDGTTATLLANLKLATKGRILNVQIFQTAGTSTYTPTPGTVTCIAEVVGGGGSGGNAATTTAGQVSVGSGGGGGGWAMKRAPVATFSGQTVTVGAGGASGSAVSGGTSSIGAVMSASGGSTGATGPGAAPNNTLFGISGGGIGSGGDLNESGWPGQSGLYASTAQSGQGGASKYGGGPFSVGGGASSGTAGITATSHGAGGSGAAAGASVATNTFGGAGKQGLIIIWEYS